MIKTILLFLLMILTSIINAQTVTIGKQVWMSKNLDVDKFRNGDLITEAKTDLEWIKAREEGKPAWCYYDNFSGNGTKYGKIYNWYAINDPRGLAPEGYHIPTDAEWNILIDFLGGIDIAGKKMKSTSGWKSYTIGGSKTCPNCKSWNAEYRSKVPCHICKDTRTVPSPIITKSGNGSYSNGFSGLPGGFRIVSGTFVLMGEIGCWWSSIDYYNNNAWSRALHNNDDNVKRYNSKDLDGFYVRCLRD